MFGLDTLDLAVVALCVFTPFAVGWIIILMDRLIRQPPMEGLEHRPWYAWRPWKAWRRGRRRYISLD